MKAFKYSGIAAALMAVSQSAQAEDIKLYVNSNVKTEEKPRVIVVFDTSGSMGRDAQTGNSCSNCTSRMDVAKTAISDLVEKNKTDIDFGLMRLRGSNGGYVLAGLGSSASKIKDEIDDLTAGGNTPIEETLYEAYRYLTGGEVDQARWTNDRDTSVELGDDYVSPFSKYKDARCDNSINMILMTDGDPTSDNDRDGVIEDLHEGIFGYEANELHNSSLHILAKSMYGLGSDNADENINIDLYTATSTVQDFARTYTIGFGNGMSDKGKELLEQTAKLGGGQYIHAETGDKLSEALENTINKIREVNDTFTSPAIASNNFDRTRSRDSLYYAMFYPDEGTRWSGNLKKLKVNGDDVLDSNKITALDDTTGTLKKNARTYWLPDGEENDGAVVHRGGVNGALVRASSRTVYTDTGGGLTSFDFQEMRDALGGSSEGRKALRKLFGASSNPEVKSLVKWSLGEDAFDDDSDGDVTEKRDAIMGDPLHSKPVAIDYGGDVRILVGTNAGYVHMFKDDEQANTVSESWAFIPSELFDIIKPLKNNDTGKLYGMDGPISVHFDDKNGNGVVEDGDKVWAFFGMRRGGSSYYALDLSNKDKPELLWTISSGDSDFAEMGQSWSRMEVVYVNHNQYKGRPLLAFGAGYDTNKDNVTRTPDSKGVGIFLVDAESGELVWKKTSKNGFTGSHSIASNISYLDSDYDGYVDRFYASDTGGDVWRFDLPGDDPSSSETPWTHFKLASLGGATAGSDRRFFYKPMVARTYFSKVISTEIEEDGKTTTSYTRQSTPYDAILLGSGNRPEPLATSVSDMLFMIRDENVITQSFKENIPAPVTFGDLMNVNDDKFAAKLDDVEGFMELEYELGNSFDGWYYSLGVGEKSLAAPTVVGGVAYFSSFIPGSEDSTENQCSLGGGEGGIYAFHLHYGTKVYNNLKIPAGDSIPDTPTVVWMENDKGGSEARIVTKNNVIEPKKVQGPAPVVNGDDIELYTSPAGISLKTQQTYIYRLEDNRDN
ncbi:pilin biogenesis protein [Pseudoalteromonas ruthenica]|uniref:pilus assembly protein n=1 Tax=Pseudoalteromonas ruthenica TaxID=151081 RepID=UPI0011099422|nr:PilC/PilY family type IV pilus protein [Pseudoalteromonas ruthenica]TLX51008.1 pilin biogenesis protein [Pseudoalteromonas ruthenica]